MEVLNFDIEDFEKHKQDEFTIGNKVLYDLCDKHCNHINEDEIHAKIWLIGRAYAAAIERRKNKTKINDHFYKTVVQEMIRFNNEKEFDKMLEKLNGKEFSKETIKDILLIHQELTSLFKKLTELEKRSLASKYLHFHCPIFPIYDSRANNALRKLVKGKSSEEYGDKEYSNFCHKILELYENITEKTGNTPSMRQIDTYLIHIANEDLNNNSV